MNEDKTVDKEKSPSKPTEKQKSEPSAIVKATPVKKVEKDEKD